MMIVGLFVLLACLVLVLMLGVSYQRWKLKRLAEIGETSLLAELPCGTMEYSLEGVGSDRYLLYLHGSPGGQDHRVSPEGFLVLAPSRPGYLKTPLSVGSSPEAQALALKQLLDNLELGPVVVMGASGGGPAALAFASQYPESVEQLILLEAVSDSMSLPEVPSFMASDFLYWLTMNVLQRVLGMKRLVQMFIPDSANSARVLANKEKLARFSKMIWSLWPYSMRQSGWENDRDQFSNLEINLSKITAPTLIVHGTADRSVAPEQSAQLSEKLVNAKLEWIEGADHMMPISHDEELSAIVQSFCFGESRPM